MRDLPKIKLDLNKPETFGNVAEKLDDDVRRTLATDLIELVGVDEGSMSDWAGRAQGYLDKLENEEEAQPQEQEAAGSNDEPAPSTEMTLSAVIQFSARATAALLGEPDLAKASEPGDGNEALAEWVSSQLRSKDPNWTLDTDPLVVHMAVTGLAWRKRDFDDDDKVFHSHFLPGCGPFGVIVNSNVRAIERAPRITQPFERYPYEIERSIERGRWVDYGPRYDDNDPQAPKKFYEMDVWLDLDGDGINEPWTIVASREDLPEVVRIRPRWSAKTVTDTKEALYFNPIRRFYPYRFLPDPKGGFFPMGFGKLLDRTESSANRLLSSIVNTAKSESENGGLLSGSGVGLPDKIETQGDRITSIPMDGAPLTNRFQAFPVKSVSPGSVAVFERLLKSGEQIAGTLNLLDNAPASMSATMAKGLIDNGSQVQSAVHRRLTENMTQEFRMFVQMADAYDVLPKELSVSNKDGVAVTADPQLATEMQRSALAGVYMEMLKQAAEGVPWKVEVLQLRLGRVLRLPNPEELIGQRPQPQLDPKDKAKATLDLMKLQTEKMKVTAAVAVQLTQALKNLVDAGSGMIDQRAGMLQVAQLEQAVQSLLEGSSNVGSGLDGMASQPGNAAPGALPAPPESGNGPDVSGGGAGGPQDAGQGGGVP